MSNKETGSGSGLHANSAPTCLWGIDADSSGTVFHSPRPLPADGIHWAYMPTMQTIQVVVDPTLLKAADEAAKRENQNRSELVREALRRHLKWLDDLALEARDRAGFLAQPQGIHEYRPWEDVAAWPED